MSESKSPPEPALLTSFCFKGDSLSGEAVVRAIDTTVAFEPISVRGSIAKLDGAFKSSVRERLMMAKHVDSLIVRGARPELETFQVASIPAWNLQVLYWTTLFGEAPPLHILHGITGWPGFTAGTMALADEVFWQSEGSLLAYEQAGRSVSGLSLVPDEVFGGERVDVSQNPGRRSLFVSMWLQAGWKMWFGDGSFRFFAKERLAAFADAAQNVALPTGAVFIELFQDPIATPEAMKRRRERDFRTWTGMDSLEAQAADLAAGEGDPTIEFSEGAFAHGGIRLMTEWFDQNGNPCRRSRASSGRLSELDATGAVVYQSRIAPVTVPQ